MVTSSLILFIQYSYLFTDLVYTIWLPLHLSGLYNNYNQVTSSLIWFRCSTSLWFIYRKLAHDFFRIYHSRASGFSSERSLDVFCKSSFISLIKSLISSRAFSLSLQYFIIEPTTKAFGMTLVCQRETSSSSILKFRR